MIRAALILMLFMAATSAQARNNPALVPEGWSQVPSSGNPNTMLAAVVGLRLTGQTMNIMTLGGLALAIGILVDEATVSIESIHSHLASGTSRAWSAIDASRKTALPRLLAMLCVLSVFLPSFFGRDEEDSPT